MNALDTLVDICSSGDGDLTGTWHQKQLKEWNNDFFTSQQDRDSFFMNQFIPEVQANEGWDLDAVVAVQGIMSIKGTVKVVFDDTMYTVDQTAV